MVILLVASVSKDLRDFIRRGIQIENDLANKNYYTQVLLSFMNQLCSNFRCQFVRIVFKLNTRRNEISEEFGARGSRRLTGISKQRFGWIMPPASVLSDLWNSGSFQQSLKKERALGGGYGLLEP